MAYLIIGPRGEVSTGRLVIIDTETNESVVVEDVVERTVAPRPPLKHSNGKIYFHGNPLREVDLAAGTITPRGSMASRDNYQLREGPDGRIWMGGSPQLQLSVYDPTTYEITDCGNPWPGYSLEAGEAYVYTMEVDPSGDYVYCGLGQLPWRLAVWDVVNSQWLYPFGGGGDDAASTIPDYVDTSPSHVARNADGECFYRRNSIGKWYRLNGASVTEVSAPTTQPEEVTNGVRMTVSGFGVETDFSALFPGSDGVSTVRYRPIGSTDSFTEATFNIPVYDIPVWRLLPLTNGQVLIVPRAYYSLALLDPDTNVVTTLAPTGSSNYGILEVNGKIYLGGYSNSFHEYDPAQPWTLDKVKQGAGNSSTNPAHFAGFAKRNYWIDTLEGKIYVGAQEDRGATGSAVGEFDPATKTKRKLRDGLEDWSMGGFCVAAGRLIHSIRHRPGTQDARLWIIDPVTMTKEDEVVPIVGRKSSAQIVRVGDDVVGCGGDKAYRVRISDKQVVWETTLPGSYGTLLASYDRNLALGADGNIYLWIGARLWRLNPETGEATKTGLYSTVQGWLSFASNGDLWIAGGTNPRRVKAEVLYQ